MARAEPTDEKLKIYFHLSALIVRQNLCRLIQIYIFLNFYTYYLAQIKYLLETCVMDTK
jgi:hypothetical protein